MTSVQRKAERLVAHYTKLIADIDAQLPASFKGAFKLTDGQISRENTPPSVISLIKLKERYWTLLNEQQDILDGYGSSKCFRVGGIYV